MPGSYDEAMSAPSPRGATGVDLDSDRVDQDPDCVFKDLCLDTGDPARSAAFWAPVLGLTAEPRGDTFVLGGEVPE